MKKRYLRKIVNYVYLVRLNKPFLAIPFAITSAFLACDGIPNLRKLTGLLIAAFFGFFAGNAFNAVTDREIDRKNPRSANRPVAAGNVSVQEALLVMGVCVLGVFAGTALIDWKYILLLPIPLIFCLGYSLTKRFTWLCHVALGITNAICPVAGWGIFGGWKSVSLIIVGAIVFFWTIGFELLYSTQDAEYDRKNGMKSIPAIFGCTFACRLSIVCHVIMFMLWIVLCVMLHPGVVFMIGLFATAPLMFYEHMLVRDSAVTNPVLAFDINQVYSILVMLFSVVNSMVKGWFV